ALERRSQQRADHSPQGAQGLFRLPALLRRDGALRAGVRGLLCCQHHQQAALQTAFNIVVFVMVLLAPLLTMRLVSLEKEQGTIELLLTNPVRDVELVLGKYLA